MVSRRRNSKDVVYKRNSQFLQFINVWRILQELIFVIYQLWKILRELILAIQNLTSKKEFNFTIWPTTVKYAKVSSCENILWKHFPEGIIIRLFSKWWTGERTTPTDRSFLYPLPPIWFPLPLYHCSPLTKYWLRK